MIDVGEGGFISTPFNVVVVRRGEMGWGGLGEEKSGWGGGGARWTWEIVVLEKVRVLTTDRFLSQD